VSWEVRVQRSTGEVVERFDTEDEARAAVAGHQAEGMPIALKGPAPPGATIPDYCSFCGKPRSKVERLIAGPTGADVAICSDCVALCARIIGLRLEE
jgi:hypothetical protein